MGMRFGTMAQAVNKIAVLIGTVLGGYADELFNVLYRLEPHKAIAQAISGVNPECGRFAKLMAFSKGLRSFGRKRMPVPKPRASNK
jgi:hypothetical protein